MSLPLLNGYGTGQIARSPFPISGSKSRLRVSPLYYGGLCCRDDIGLSPNPYIVRIVNRRPFANLVSSPASNQRALHNSCTVLHFRCVCINSSFYQWVIGIRNLHTDLLFLQKCIDIYFLACYNQGIGFLILQKEKNYG